MIQSTIFPAPRVFSARFSLFPLFGVKWSGVESFFCISLDKPEFPCYNKVSYDTKRKEDTPTHSTQRNIEAFLKLMRDAIDNGMFTFIPRPDNMRTLATLGITPTDAKDRIRSLTAADYICGPENDRDRPGTDGLWIFKKVISSQLIYIKLKLCLSNTGELKAISFHIDNTP